jgi:predicted RNA-binding Zn-ribbon protein involved in translation (DUF1610 family)
MARPPKPLSEKWFRRKARESVETHFRCALTCLACDHHLPDATYSSEALYLPCPACGRRQMVRDEADVSTADPILADPEWLG